MGRASDVGATAGRGGRCGDAGRRLLVESNDAAASFPHALGVHHLIEAQAGRTPEAVVVVGGEDSLTYGDLDAGANRLAHHLRGLGVGPDTVVGLCLTRRPEMVVAVLAILKAGGAYLPLDPDYPAQRLGFMLDDSAASVVVTEERLSGKLPAHHARVVCLDQDRTIIDQQPSGHPPEGAFDASQMFNVIYTSGSTGRPKGVQVLHRGMVNLLTAMATRPGLGPDDRIVAVTTLSFDIAGLELCLPLTVGATVVVAPAGVAAAPRAIMALLDASEATVMQATPSTWRLLIDAGWRGPPGFKVFCGGEALSAALASALLDREVELWNMYGPTETTVYSVIARVTAASQAGTIGWPIPNTTVYILDPSLDPVPVGVAGELHIGGAGLARGYLQRPELTAERFIAHPFDPTPGARLYRTGDLVRGRGDGSIEFLGRIDHQVKVRGFRVELGEVEAALERQPGVHAAVVVAPPDPSGSRRLVAYVVPESRPLTSSELRDRLLQQLPGYMVPSAFVSLVTFPLTPNGKVDRAALPAPPTSRPDLAPGLVAPRGALQRALAGIWADVLGIEEVGIEDDFFELGGHSLLSLRVIARIQERLDVCLSAGALYEAPTVAELALLISRLDAPRTRLPRLVPTGAARAPLSLAQETMWALVQAAPPGFYNVSTSLSIAGGVDHDALVAALTLVVERHSALRTAFRADAASPYQAVVPACGVGVEVIDLRSPSPTDPGRQFSDLQPRLRSAPFDLARPPLLRAHLCLLSETDACLVLIFHHLIVDAASLTIITGELRQAYQAFAGGRAPQLPPVDIGYQDFSIWQRRRYSNHRLRVERAYWRRRLNGMPLRPELPYDRRPSPTPSDLTDYVHFFVPWPSDQTLVRLARATHSTALGVVLALTAILISRSTGATDIAVRTVFTGRDRTALEPVVGNFANIAFLRLDLAGDPSFSSVARRAGAAVIGMLENGHVPFTTVRDDLISDLLRAGTHAEPEIPVAIEYNAVAGVPPDVARLNAAARPPLSPTLDELAIRFFDNGHSIWGNLGYHVELFDRGHAAAMVDDLLRVAEAVYQNHGLRLSQLCTDKPLLDSTRSTCDH